MYKVSRIVPVVTDIPHTDNMYRVKRFVVQPQKSDSSNAPVDETVYSELQKLDNSLTYLLNLLEQYHRTHKNRRPEGKSNSTHAAEPKKERITAVQKLKSETFVIQANPDAAPIAILLLCDVLLNQNFNVVIKSYVHSTVKKLPVKLSKFVDNLVQRSSKNLHTDGVQLHLVWNHTCPDCMSYVNTATSPLFGESVLILHMLPALQPDNFKAINPVLQSLDSAFCLVETRAPLELPDQIKSHIHFTKVEREFPSAADCLLLSHLKRLGLIGQLPPTFSSWSKFCQGLLSTASAL